MIREFHVHIYYDPKTKMRAERVRADIEASEFNVRVGRMHDGPIGPHTKGMFQVVFYPGTFGAFVPWLMLNSYGLSVLIHPETGDELADHLQRALWLGEKVPLKLEALS